MQKLPKFPWPSRQQNSKEYQKCCDFLLSHLALRDDSNWPVARRLLIDRYALTAQLIDELHETNSIYAARSDIVFTHRSFGTEDITGATLLPIRGKSLWRTIGDDRHAWFVIGNSEHAFRVIIVENPIEALSYHTLFPGETVVVCADSLRELMPILNSNQRIVIAFCDTDKIIKAVRSVQKANGFWAFKGHRSLSANWNEELRCRKKHNRQPYYGAI